METDILHIAISGVRAKTARVRYLLCTPVEPLLCELTGKLGFKPRPSRTDFSG